MILPTKHISADQALVGVGAVLLEQLGRPQTVSGLWEQARDVDCVGTFERFILGLDFLFIVGAIKWSDGLLRRDSE